MHTSDAVIAGLYFLGAAGSLYFVVRYALTRWWKTAEGRSMMSLHLVMVGFACSAVLRLILGPYYPGRTYIAAFLFAWLAWSIWSFSFLLERAQRDARRTALVDQTVPPSPEGTHPPVEDHQLG
jgi:hypothetical protein